MDGNRFDALTRGLVRETSRRRALGGAFGGAVAILTGATAFAARDRVRRDDKDGDGVEDTTVASGALAGGIWEESIAVCRFNPETGGYIVRNVSMISLPEHLNRGDTLYIDCCAYKDCRARECLTVTGCVEGACAYEATEGASCRLRGGVMGVCTRKGECVSTAPVTPAGTTIVEQPAG